MVEEFTGCLGAILAGGASRRFGSPKGLAEVDGQSIVDRVDRALGEVLGRVVIVTDAPDLYRVLTALPIADLEPGLGPLAGIHAALAFATGIGASSICCAPCDAPFYDSALVGGLISHSDGASAVVPARDGAPGFEPTFGWYSTSLLPAIEARLRAGELSVGDLVRSEAGVRILPLSAIASIANPELIFTNVNTPADLIEAQRIAKRRRW